MAKTKQIVEAEIAPVEVVQQEVIEILDSEVKKAYMDMMINYQKSNPVKYAQKEAGFIKKLNTL